jgi:hypothetical protein
MVWPLPAAEGLAEPGRLAVRIIKAPEEPTWFHLEARIEGEPGTQITQVRVGAYPFITSGPPERQRWVSTLTSAYQMTDQLQAIDPGTEWGVVLHNKVVQEEGGCLFVFNPRQVEGARAGGTYNVSLHMDATPGTQAMQFAFGYFWDEDYAQAVERFRPLAPQVLDRLKALDWSVGCDEAQWAKLSAEMGELLTHEAVRQGFEAQWGPLAEEATRLLARSKETDAPAREAERRFGALVAEARKLKSAMYASAVEALVQEAGQ